MERARPWKKLASELKEHGIESEYLARIEARVSSEERLENIESEIAQAVCGALGRSGDRVDMALAELELCKARYERALQGGASAEELAPLVEAYNAQRLIAQRRRHDLLIHREAAGFRRNQLLNELYPIPARISRQPCET